MLRREFLFVTTLPLLPPIQSGSTLRFLAQNRYYAKAGREKEVYDLRLHASSVLERIGVAPGQVYRGRGGDEPDAIWQVEFANRDAARDARRTVSTHPDFISVQERMGKLIRRFESSLYQEVIPTMIDDKRG